MARKKHAKTPEQRLGEALVPREEQPYAVPDNWCWVRLGACINKSTDKQTVCTSDDCYIGLENMESGKGVISYGDASALKSEKAVFHPGQVLYGRLRPYLDKHDVAEVEGVCSTDILVYDVNPCSDARYIDYLMSTRRFVRHASSCAKGVNLPRVSPADVERFPIPLPPLAEQRRIVERVEGLFARLDEAEKHLSRIISESGQRRTAIFHKAFCGELTLSWRRTHHGNGKSPLGAIREYSLAWKKKDQRLLASSQSRTHQDVKDGFSWVECSIGAIGRVANGCTPSRKEPSYWGDDIPWISSGEVRNNIIAKTRERVSKTGFDSTSLQLLPEGTVLIAMIGEGKTRGQSSVLAIPAAINQNIAAVVIDHGLVEPKFLWYWFRYSYERNRQEGSGSGPQALNCQRVRDLPFILPELEEQKEIVRRIDSLLEKEQHLIDFASKAVGAIVRLKPRLLADAMRGKLGTNDASDPSAREELFSMIESGAIDS